MLGTFGTARSGLRHTVAKPRNRIFQRARKQGKGGGVRASAARRGAGWPNWRNGSISSNVSPVYIAEVSPAEWRGAMVALNQLTIVVGILAAQIVNWLIAQRQNTNAWKL